MPTRAQQAADHDRQAVFGKYGLPQGAQGSRLHRQNEDGDRAQHRPGKAPEQAGAQSENTAAFHPGCDRDEQNRRGDEVDNGAEHGDPAEDHVLAHQHNKKDQGAQGPAQQGLPLAGRDEQLARQSRSLRRLLKQQVLPALLGLLGLLPPLLLPLPLPGPGGLTGLPLPAFRVPAELPLPLLLGGVFPGLPVPGLLVIPALGFPGRPAGLVYIFRPESPGLIFRIRHGSSLLP